MSSLKSLPLYPLSCMPSIMSLPLYLLPCLPLPFCPLLFPHPCIPLPLCPPLYLFPYMHPIIYPPLWPIPYIPFLISPPTLNPPPPPPHYLTGSQWQIKKARNGCHPSSMSLNSWFKLLKRKPLNESDQNNKVMGTNANLFICLFHTRGFKYISTDWEYRLKTGVLSHDSLTYRHINYVVFLLV